MSTAHPLLFGTWSLYEFVAGPLAGFSLLLFAGGVCFRILQFFALTRKKEQVRYQPVHACYHARTVSSPHGISTRGMSAIRNSILGTHCDTTIVTAVLHVLLFLIPLSVRAHTVLFYDLWGLQLVSVPEATSDILTIIFLGCAGALILRRTMVSRVRSISTFADYAVWLITVAPFVTGFIAHQHWFDYYSILVLHVVSAELMLAAIAFTRLGHMMFFVLSRFFIAGEYSFGRGSRTC
nr:hypothetical protein [Deltaproteobacteria bacterium]